MDNDRDIGRARRGPQAAADAPPPVATPTGPGDGRQADSAAGADESRWRRLGKLLEDRVPAVAPVLRWLAKLTVGPVAQAVQRVAKVALALVALVVALDVVGALQATTHRSVENEGRWIGPMKQTSKWIRAARQATAADTAIRRLLTVQLDRDTLTVTYDLWLPPGHDLFRAVQDGQANSDSAWLVHDVLGDVRVGEFPQGLPNSRRTWETTLSFDPPVVQTTMAEGHVRLTSKPYWFSLSALQVSVDKPAAVDAPVAADGLSGGLPLTADLAVVRSDRLQVFRQGGPAPVWQTNQRAEFDRLGSDQVLRFMVTKPGASSLRSALFGMGGASLPVLAGLQGRVTLLLVVIALLLWLEAAGDYFHSLADIVRATFVYVLGVAVVGAIADASWSLAWYPRPLADVWLESRSEPKQVGALALTIVAAAMLWPLMVARTHRRLSAAGPAKIRPQPTITRETSRAPAMDNGEPRPGPADQGHAIGTLKHRPANADGNAPEQGGRRVVKALVIAAVAIASARIPLVAAEEPLRHRGTLGLTIVAFVVAAYLLSRYLATKLVGGPRAWTVATVATLTGVGVALAYPVFGYVYSDQTNAVRVGIFVFVAVVFAVAYAIYAATATRFLATAVDRSNWSSWLVGVVVLGLLAVTIPDIIGVAVDPLPEAEVGPWNLFTMADSLTTVSVYLLLACLVVALRWLGRPDLEGTNPLLVRRAGILFAILTFYWFGEQWFWLPISLLLGWLVAATIAFPRDDSAADTSWFTDRVVEVTEQLRASLYALDANRAKLKEQFREGRIDHAEFGSKVQSLNRARRVASRHVSDLGDDGNDPGRLRKLLRTGGWRHAVPATWWGLVLGSPWIALYLWQIGSAAVAHTDYEALEFGAGTASWIVLQWPLYGFFFGYFYPRLRGHSGVAKALTVFVTVVLPPVAYHALAGQRSDWQTYGIFALQMLLFCLLLGALAGDYLLLRRVGLGWRQMLDVHNLRFVLTLGSSIAVASGGLLVTILSSGLSVVVSALLEQAGISTPNAPTPMDLRR